MDMELRLLESLSCREHFFLTTSILDGERTAFYDVVGTTWMIVPGKYLTRRY